MITIQNKDLEKISGSKIFRMNETGKLWKHNTNRQKRTNTWKYFLAKRSILAKNVAITKKSRILYGTVESIVGKPIINIVRKIIKRP